MAKILRVAYSSLFLDYRSQGHPESPSRVKLIYKKLEKNRNFEFIEPKSAKISDLLLVHTKDHVESVKNNSFIDADTPNIDNIYEIAKLSAGSAIKSSEMALALGSAFSLARPPGHHASKNKVGGFCYFNNIAIAVAKIYKRIKKVAILDIDVHHGNGTQDIFLGRSNIIFCSLHQVPLYPGTGLKSKKNCFNFPLYAGSNFMHFRNRLISAVKIIEEFHPKLLAVSLGFDTYKKDALANVDLEIKDYREIGKIIKKLKVPTFFVLEGGYSKDIGILAKEFFLGFLNYPASVPWVSSL